MDLFYRLVSRRMPKIVSLYYWWMADQLLIDHAGSQRVAFGFGSELRYATMREF